MNQCRYCLACVFIGVFLVLSNAIPGGEAVKPTRVGLEKGVAFRVDEELSFEDSIVDRRLAKPYLVRLEKDVAYEIDLRSLTLKPIEPYLILKDANGRVIAENKDGSTANSRISYTPKQTADFQVIATTFAFGQTGRFTLTIAEKGAAPAPQRIGLKNGRTRRIGHHFDTEPVEQGKKCLAYLCEFSKDKCYRICLESSLFDPYLILCGPDTKVLAADDDSLGDYNSEIVWTAPADGTYRILAAEYRGSLARPKVAAPFVLTVDEVKILSLENGKAALAGRLNREDPSVLIKNQNKKPSAIVMVSLQAGKRYQFDLISKDFDSYLFLAAPNGAKLAEDDDNGGNLNSRITYTVPTTGAYRLRIATWNGATGAYDLKVEELDP